MPHKPSRPATANTQETNQSTAYTKGSRTPAGKRHYPRHNLHICYIPSLKFGPLERVDTKTIDRISDPEIGQMMNYLKITNLKLGYIINFKHPKLEWKRIIR